MIITDLFESHHACPECGGPAFSDLILAEKKDACYYKVKASAKVWPSAYASGRLVQCRKKGAANYGKSKNEGVAEGSLEEVDRRGFLKGMGAAAVAGAAGGALAQSKPADISAELARMTKDDHRIQHNKDVNELARAIYERMVAERGQPMDRRQQQQWLEIARLKAEERFSQYAPGKPSTTKPSAGFPSQPSEYRRSRNLDNFESVDQGVAENKIDEGEQLFYAKNPDGTKIYARIKDQEQQAQLQQKYAGSEVKMLPFDRPDVAEWLVSRGVKLRGFLPGMVITKGLSKEQGVAEDQLDEKCWDGYQQQGTKNKGGRQVPNCVPAESVAEGEPGDLENELNRQEYNDDKIGGRYDPDDFDAMVARLKKLAGAGPMKTVYDPQKRVYRNVPTAVQPKK